MQAVPDKQKISRIESITTGTPLIRQKIDSDVAEDLQPLPTAPLEVNLPEIPGPFIYLKELFFLSGQALQSGMGLIPLTWQELDAFIRVNELDLMIWEKRILRKMSEAYCTESSRATDPMRPAPYTPEKDDEEETVVDKISKAEAFQRQLMALRGK